MKSTFTCIHVERNLLYVYIQFLGTVHVILNGIYVYRRVYLSIAAASIYMASQASDIKKTQKGTVGGL